ncbi:MAG: 5-formyltetrahydrofolate cyclo-ligase [Victivallales bacterium]|nr:5-formyltetrahydrofolate cyclo-ligase [Victivallales bacterium]
MASGSDKSVDEGKAALRAEYKERLRGLCGRDRLSAALVSRLAASELLSAASVMVGFMPIRQEPDIFATMESWLSAGRRLFLPAYSAEDCCYRLAEVGGLDESWMSRGKFGIPEPVRTITDAVPPFHFTMPAIWLVPGLAFSEDGARLGRGGGYYDRLLKGADGVKVGLLYECQIAAAIPALDYDIRMDFLLTETRTIDCAKA